MIYQTLPLLHMQNIKKKTTTQREWSVHNWNEHQPNFIRNIYSFTATIWLSE